MGTIPLSQSQFAIVDDEWHEKISRFKWSLTSAGYAMRIKQMNGRRINVLMHREILGTPAGMVTDHINGDKLDNRRSNLRFSTKSQNAMNRKINANNKTGYRGVFWVTRLNCYIAKLQVERRDVFSRCFHSQHEAAIIWNYYATKHYGDFAVLNDVSHAIPVEEQPEILASFLKRTGQTI